MVQRLAILLTKSLISPIDSLFDPVNEVLDSYASNTFKGAISNGQLRLVTCFILGIPLGFILYHLKSPRIRRIYSLTIGILLQLFAYQGWVVVAHAHSILVFMICKLSRRHAPSFVFIISFILLSAVHLYRQYLTQFKLQQNTEEQDDFSKSQGRTSSQHIDISIIFMMNFQRYISFAFSLKDGTPQQKKEESNSSSSDTKQQKHVSSEQLSVAIFTFPSFYEYLGYINFMGSAVAGPAFDYTLYTDFINRNGYYMKHIPSTIMATLRSLIFASIEIAIVILGMPIFPISYVLTEAYAQEPLIYRFIYFTISVMIVRARYYAGWRLIQCAMNVTGITYDGNGFNRFTMIEEDLELTYTIKDLIAKWNCTTQVWLKNYVYLRVFPDAGFNAQKRSSKIKMIIAQNITLLVSAFWHGFYPGYFIAFFFWGIQLSLIKTMQQFEKNTPLGKAIICKYPRIWMVFNVIWMKMIINCFGVIFVLLSLESCLIFMKNLHYIPIIFLLIAYLGINSMNASKNLAKVKQ